jgi:hypothetical protein
MSIDQDFSTLAIGCGIGYYTADAERVSDKSCADPVFTR